MHSATILILALSCVSFQAYSLPLEESSVPLADDAEVFVDADASVKTDTEEGAVEPVEPEEPEQPEDPNEASTSSKVALLGSHDEEGEATISGIQPEKGDKMPAMVKTFAGCGCIWEGSWFCKGSIALPESQQGNPCCCCTLGCHKSNRCTNEQCRAIGVDQAAEIAAEEKRLRDLLQGADMLLGGQPFYKVEVGPGRCMRSKIVKACNDEGLTPLCDQFAYWGAGGKKCWYMDDAKYKSRHFSLPAHNKLAGLDTNELAGMCFFGVNGDNALANTGTTHSWTNAGATTAVTGPGGQRWTFGDMDNQANGQEWFTLCVKGQPQT